MQKLFVANEDFEKEYTRKKAKGHKRLIVGNDVEIIKPVSLHTDGTDLVISKSEDASGTEVYTMLCKEFGLVNGASGFKNKISVIFCDNGWMLVTLLHGALVMNLDNQLLMPTVGDDFSTPKVVKDDICWVDASMLLEYGKYYDLKGRFMYDFEWTFIVGGDNVNGMRNFSIQHISDEDIDISLGYVAQYEQQLQLKQDAKDAQNIMKNILGSGENNSSGFEFDEDEDDEDITEDEDFEGDYDDFDF